jgi:hypothetical protein
MPAPPPDLTHVGLAAVERLRRIAAAAQAGEAPDATDLEWLGQGLSRYLTGAAAGSKLEDALDLAVPPGGSPWWIEQRRAEPDDAIRRLAATFPGTPSARALATADAIRGYAGVGWRHDRARGGPLTSDARRQLLFAVFKADEDPPSSMRRVYDILNSG